jgi:hypothetical protein
MNDGILAGGLFAVSVWYGFTSEVRHQGKRLNSSSISRRVARPSTASTNSGSNVTASPPGSWTRIQGQGVALAIGLVVVAALVIAHQVALLAIGAVFGGAGLVVARRRAQEARARDEKLDVADWIETHTWDTDTAGYIVDRLRGTSMAELRSQVANRAFFKGWEAAHSDVRRRRSEAARQAAAARRERTPG